MIKNVVFDFGQVLVRFDPKYMTDIYVKDEKDSLILQTVLFDRLYWDRLDLGTISDSELISEACTRLPERLHKHAADIYNNWIYNIPENEGMKELVTELKEKLGVKLFLLSNISRSFSEHSSEIPILKYFDKCIMSACYGVVKPSREIFDILCSECGIKKEESIFIDDSEKNVRGACEYGLSAYLFDGDVAALKNYLFDLLSK